jgi:hypothetical protein
MMTDFTVAPQDLAGVPPGRGGVKAEMFGVDPAQRALSLTEDFGRAEPHWYALCYCCAALSVRKKLH